MKDRMKTLILRSGITEKQFNKLSDEDLKDIYLQWNEANKIWTLPGLKPETWQLYEDMRITGLTEQLLLEDCLKELKQACTKKLKKYSRKRRSTQKSPA